tara:strand:- start:148 stop:327 length:180 start_codon:yes stop_codon:yes gene_type:complete
MVRNFDVRKRWGFEKKFNKSKNNKFLNEMILVTSKNHNNEVLKKVIEKINFKKWLLWEA